MSFQGNIEAGYINGQPLPTSGLVGSASPNFTGTPTISGQPVKKRPKLRNLVKAGHNGTLVIMDDVLYSAQGNSGAYGNYVSGCGLTGAIPQRGALQGWLAIPFPTTETGKLVKAGTNGLAVAWALFDNGNLYTWGFNSVGTCGLGHTNQVPNPVLSNTLVVDVYDHPSNGEYSAGDDRLFIKKQDGYIYGTGYNVNGALGVGDTTNRSSWVQLTALGTGVSQFFNLGSSSGIAVAVDATGKIRVCGSNTNGVLGNGNSTQQNSFIDVTAAWAGVGVTAVTSIQLVASFRRADPGDAINQSMVMLITQTNGTKRLVSCGLNTWGQLGLGNTTSFSTPQQITTIANPWKLGTSSFACYYCITESKVLYAWGYNTYGQLGTGNTAQQNTPVVVQNDVEEFVGSDMTEHQYSPYGQMFIKKTDKTVWGAGYNGHGQVGVASYTSISTFTRLPFIPNDEIVEFGCFVTAGSAKTILARSINDNLYVWGYGAQNAIQPDFDQSVNVPIRVYLP